MSDSELLQKIRDYCQRETLRVNESLDQEYKTNQYRGNPHAAYLEGRRVTLIDLNDLLQDPPDCAAECECKK